MRGENHRAHYAIMLLLVGSSYLTAPAPHTDFAIPLVGLHLQSELSSQHRTLSSYQCPTPSETLRCPWTASQSNCSDATPVIQGLSQRSSQDGYSVGSLQHEWFRHYFFNLIFVLVASALIPLNQTNDRRMEDFRASTNRKSHSSVGSCHCGGELPVVTYVPTAKHHKINVEKSGVVDKSEQHHTTFCAGWMSGRGSKSHSSL